MNWKDIRVIYFKGEVVSFCLNLYVELVFKLEMFLLFVDIFWRGFDKLGMLKELLIICFDF